MSPTVVATKVFEEECEVCKQMERHDTAVFQEFDEVVYHKVDLDRLIEGPRSQVEQVVYNLLERHCLNPDYTVDLPVYLLVDTRGNYLGHHTGAATVSELRERVKTILSPEQEDP
jgi:hypothetical protein